MKTLLKHHNKLQDQKRVKEHLSNYYYFTYLYSVIVIIYIINNK